MIARNDFRYKMERSQEDLDSAGKLIFELVGDGKITSDYERYLDNFARMSHMCNEADAYLDDGRVKDA